jgi:hypothetical protein
VIIALSGARAIAADEGAGAAAKGKITGTVHHEDGSVAANVNVRVLPAPSAADKKANKGAQTQAADEGAKPGEGEKPAKPERPKPVAEGKTDASGKFEIEVPAGKYQVVAMLRGQGRTQKTVEVKAGETKDLGTLTLKKGGAKKEAPAAQ